MFKVKIRVRQDGTEGTLEFDFVGDGGFRFNPPEIACLSCLGEIASDLGFGRTTGDTYHWRWELLDRTHPKNMSCCV